MPLEKMDAFFDARIDIYDEHMLADVVGCKEGYEKLAELVPSKTRDLLDLGCGTGLELELVFKKLPDVRVTGIDLTKSMLDKLAAKYPGKDIALINTSYLGYDFGAGRYDTAISFETMHHFSRAEKVALYQNIRAALRDGGCYIECDYMCETKREEDELYAEFARLRKEENIPEGEFYHFDTPCTPQTQVGLFLQAGFANAEIVWRMGSTTIVVARK